MKTKRRILSVILTLLIFTQIFSNTKLNVLATGGVNTFSVGSINGESCYEYSDPSLLPNTFSVYWVYGGKVCTAPATKWLITALNKKLGTTFTDNWFTDFNTYFMTQIMTASSLLGDFFSGGATRVSNGTSVVGVAFNDLTGLTLENDIPSTAVCTTPSNVTNVTYNILNNYIEHYPIEPSFIVFQTYTSDEAISYLDVSQTNYNSILSAIQNNTSNYLNYFTYETGWYQSYHFTLGDGWDTYYYAYDLSNYTFFTDSTTFSNVCNELSLSLENNYVNQLDLFASSITSVNCSIYDPVNNQSISITTDATSTNTNNPTVSQTYNKVYAYLNGGNYRRQTQPITPTGKMTVYKDGNVINQITTNTYYQDYYISTTYKNYNNQSTENNWNTTNNEMNNSTTNNQNVYNETKTTTNNNIKNNNYNYDNSVNDNSVTNIINNYYYGDNGGGGDNGDDDDDDSPIWDALLNAIVNFFEKIGEIIAAILTGILGLLSSVLDAIADITEGFTGITTFIGSIFGFLPDELIAVLTLGITTALLVSLIRMIRK